MKNDQLIRWCVISAILICSNCKSLAQSTTPLPKPPVLPVEINPPPLPPTPPSGPIWIPARGELYRRELETYRVELETVRAKKPALLESFGYQKGIENYKNGIDEYRAQTKSGLASAKGNQGAPIR